MSKLTIIKSEIQNDPATIGYAGKTPSEQAILMSEGRSQSPAVYSDLTVNIQQLALVLLKRGKWKAVVTASASNDDAFSLVELSKLSNVNEQINVGSVKTMITNLISAGVLTNADGNALRDATREEVKLSRAEVLGIGEVRQGEVEEALK